MDFAINYTYLYNWTKYLIIVFFFWQKFEYNNIHMLHFDKCIYLCNAKPYQDIEHDHHPKKISPISF